MSRSNRLVFGHKLFNPNFFHFVNEMRNPARRFIFGYGGSSSAKSYSWAQAILIFCCLIEGSDTLVFRKVSANIEKSIYKDFQELIENLGLQDYFTCLQLKIRCYNGAVIDFSGIDDPEKIKGISGYKRVLLEEVSEFDEADFKQIRKRLRGKIGQQILCAFNPIDIDHWLKTALFDNQAQSPMNVSLDRDDMLFMARKLGDWGILDVVTDVTQKWEGAPVVVDGKTYPPNFVVMKSTYKNNFWVVGSPCGTYGFYDIQTIADFEADRVTDFSFYSIYALGEWGKLNIGGEAYKHFDTAKHTGKFEYDPEKSLHLTFDENVNPYMTLDVFQGEDLKVRQINEICLADPKNTLDDTLRAFVNEYPNNGNTVYIYGDATSRKEDVKLQKGKNFYTLVENYLRKRDYTTQMRVTKSNPNVEVRINWINKILRDNYDEIDFKISDKCVKTIADYKYLKSSSDGKKHKEKTRHPITKVTYEKYGHNTDANDYFLCRYFETSFHKYSKPQGSKRGRSKKRVKKGGY